MTEYTDDASTARQAAPAFAPLPLRAIRDKRLTQRDLRVLGAIAAHDRMTRNGQGCWAPQDRLARVTGVKANHVGESIKHHLVPFGYVAREDHPWDRRRSRLYVIYTDEDGQFFTNNTGAQKSPSDGTKEGPSPGTNTVSTSDEISPSAGTYHPEKGPSDSGVFQSEQQLSDRKILNEALVRRNSSEEGARAGARDPIPNLRTEVLKRLLDLRHRTIAADLIERVAPSAWQAWAEAVERDETNPEAIAAEIAAQQGDEDHAKHIG